jgi:hypothetical protein
MLCWGAKITFEERDLVYFWIEDGGDNGMKPPTRRPFIFFSLLLCFLRVFRGTKEKKNVAIRRRYSN